MLKSLGWAEGMCKQRGLSGSIRVGLFWGWLLRVVGAALVSRLGGRVVWAWKGYSGRSKSWGLRGDNHDTETGQAGGLESKAPCLRLCLNFLWGTPASSHSLDSSWLRSRTHTKAYQEVPILFFFCCRKQNSPSCIFSSNLHGFG